MKNTETRTVATVAKDQTLEDVVRESPVDQHGAKIRKRLGIIVLVLLFFLLFFC